ncbi:MAG: response regulator [candidate division Zixibacteria bacterium]|nr:response regulator [Candidatus Tariuqbacter arcticus]
MKILLIDDDSLHLSSLKTSLEVRNYKCISFLCPVSAIEAYRKEHFDVVITAVRMLEITGEEVLKTVHNINPDAKVILIVNFDDVRINIMKDDGVYALFCKPIVIDELVRILEEIEEKPAKNI